LRRYTVSYSEFRVKAQFGSKSIARRERYPFA
jgi:hypothetical protein